MSIMGAGGWVSSSPTWSMNRSGGNQAWYSVGKAAPQRYAPYGITGDPMIGRVHSRPKHPLPTPDLPPVAAMRRHHWAPSHQSARLDKMVGRQGLAQEYLPLGHLRLPLCHPLL
jgi:hypothetical protein